MPLRASNTARLRVHDSRSKQPKKTNNATSGAQIIVGRSSADGFIKRLFGSSTQNHVMHADVPVKVVG